MASLAVAGLITFSVPALGAAPAASSLLPLPNDGVPVGAWAQYDVRDRRTGALTHVRLAGLKRATKGRWFEIELTDSASGQTFIFRSLIVQKKGGGHDVLRAIAQLPGQRPVELPSEVARQAPGMGKRAARRKLGPGVAARITVPAGTFATTFHRTKLRGGAIEELWLSSKVRGWSVVRARNPKTELTLTAYGSQAKPRIIGKPIELDERLLGALGVDAAALLGGQKKTAAGKKARTRTRKKTRTVDRAKATKKGAPK